MAPKKQLSAMARKFAEFDAVHGNGAKAVVEAGYSAKNAKSQAHRLRQDPRIQDLTEEHRARLAEERTALRVSAEEQKIYTEARVRQELANIAFARITDVCSFGPNGIDLKSSAEIDDQAIAAIAEITQTQAQFGTNIKIKMHSKMSALDMCAKELGMIVNRHEVTEAKAMDLIKQFVEEIAPDVNDPAILELMAAKVEAMEDA